MKEKVSRNGILVNCIKRTLKKAFAEYENSGSRDNNNNNKGNSVLSQKILLLYVQTSSFKWKIVLPFPF